MPGKIISFINLYQTLGTAWNLEFALGTKHFSKPIHYFSAQEGKMQVNRMSKRVHRQKDVLKFVTSLHDFLSNVRYLQPFGAKFWTQDFQNCLVPWLNIDWIRIMQSSATMVLYSKYKSQKFPWAQKDFISSPLKCYGSSVIPSRVSSKLNM